MQEKTLQKKQTRGAQLIHLPHKAHFSSHGCIDGRKVSFPTNNNKLLTIGDA